MQAGFAADDVEKIRARFQVAPNEQQTLLAERFDKLLSAQWHNEAEHKALLKAAAVDGELAFVGGRYRAVLDVMRDEPRAKAAQNELLTLAMATMTSTRSDSAPSTSSARTIAMIIMVLVIGGGIFMLVRGLLSSLAGGGADGLAP